ncbi:MAG: ABC transporter ATP-binding protein [Chloroflexaceae bacterium]|nr:ABC transporter ATP-binding protein [Chloroflexaceae bacterium]
MSLLSLQKLSKTYRDGTTALVDLSLAIEPGEIITLVGPSGCGKSTLLRLIAGLDRPTGGTVWFQGRNITGLPAEQRGMGVVFQNYALFPHMSVAENVGFGLRVRGVAVSERRRTVAKLLEQLQLGDLAERRPDQLSGGQQQRVALGRALAIAPALLLLDEPLTALDAQLRETLRLELRRTLETFGITSIYVTHDQAEALTLGDRVVVMRKGQIEQVGSPRAIYQQPATPFVAQFIGVTNRVPGKLCVEGQNQHVQTALGRLPVPPCPASLSNGSQMLLLIRPEDLALSLPEQAHVHGVVSRIQFLGDRLRLFLTSEGYTPELVADVDPYTTIATGSAVALRLLRATPLVLEGYA